MRVPEIPNTTNKCLERIVLRWTVPFLWNGMFFFFILTWAENTCKSEECRNLSNLVEYEKNPLQRPDVLYGSPGCEWISEIFCVKIWLGKLLFQQVLVNLPLRHAAVLCYLLHGVFAGHSFGFVKGHMVFDRDFLPGGGGLLF